MVVVVSLKTRPHDSLYTKVQRNLSCVHDECKTEVMFLDIQKEWVPDGRWPWEENITIYSLFRVHASARWVRFQDRENYAYMVLSIRCQDPAGMKRTCIVFWWITHEKWTIHQAQSSEISKALRTKNCSPLLTSLGQDIEYVNGVIHLPGSEDLSTCITRRVHADRFYFQTVLRKFRFAMDIYRVSR